MADVKQELKKYLSRREKLRIVDARYMPAAVLIPLYCKDGQSHILFTRRTMTVRTHKGEISFPGGGYEPDDPSMLATALRETAEEIGLAPADVEILGEMDDYTTTRSNYVISPFVAHIPYPYRFRLESREIDELIEVPVAHLMESSNVERNPDISIDGLIGSYTYHYQGKVIWGATARILYHLLEIWDEVVGDTACQGE